MFLHSGGPDGEMGASMRYLSQRYSMPYDIGKAVLTDIGTEELAHLEIVATIVHQLTRNLTPEEIEASPSLEVNTIFFRNKPYPFVSTNALK